MSHSYGAGPQPPTSGDHGAEWQPPAPGHGSPYRAAGYPAPDPSYGSGQYPATAPGGDPAYPGGRYPAPEPGPGSSYQGSAYPGGQYAAPPPGPGSPYDGAQYQAPVAGQRSPSGVAQHPGPAAGQGSPYDYDGGQYLGGPATLQCRLCGCVPAAKVTFRGNRGMLLIRQSRSSPGPFCRDCGLAVFRDMSADTLLRGWWGTISSVMTPVTLINNLIERPRVARLPQPMPPPSGQYRHPADPGKPTLLRPKAIAAMAIFAAIVLIFVVAIITGGNG